MNKTTKKKLLEATNFANDLSDTVADLEDQWDGLNHAERRELVLQSEALMKKIHTRIQELDLRPPESAEKNCAACAYCFMEPSDMNFTCGHLDAGVFGKSVNIAAGPDGHCGPKRPKFEQHPKRTPDGRLN